MGVVITWIASTVAVFVAAAVVPGIEVVGGDWTDYLVVGAVVGLVNAVLGPVLKLLSLPLTVLTLGLSLLLVNAALLGLAAALLDRFEVDGLVPAVLGALLISLVSWGVRKALGDD